MNHPESLPKLKKLLWKEFARFIRVRDSSGEWFTCISCGKPQSVADGNFQAGHYFKSQLYAAIRYDERNVNGQCRRCNIFLEGNRQGYAEGLRKKYGQIAIDILDIKKNNRSKMGRWEYKALIQEYQNKINSYISGGKTTI